MTHRDENLKVLVILQVRQKVRPKGAEVLVPVKVRAILCSVPLCHIWMCGWVGEWVGGTCGIPRWLGAVEYA